MGNPLVRFVYLSPSDKPFVPAYQQDLERGVRELQRWFASKLNGLTFECREPDAVEWYPLDRPADWYRSDPAGGDSHLWFWEKALADAFAITGANFHQPEYRWMFYMDVHPACGQALGGTSGVALVGANDLRGLSGKSYIPECPGEPIWDFPWGRWVGGMGHELGHTVGLDHPEDSPGGSDDRTLMYLGYIDFPNTYLRDSDTEGLLASGFFSYRLPEE